MESDFIKSLEEKGDAVDESLLSGDSIFYRGVTLNSQDLGFHTHLIKMSVEHNITKDLNGPLSLGKVMVLSNIKIMKKKPYLVINL